MELIRLPRPGVGGILSALGAGALYETFDAPVCFLISATIPSASSHGL